MEYKLSSDTWDNKEIEAISRVITSGRYTMGNEVKSFEERFADFFEVKNAVMTNSGSSANLIAIAALRYHPKFKNKINGNIIVPTVSWSTTFFPVHQLGYKLKFVDVNVETFNIDIAEVEKNIDENTVAIFAVNLLGNPCELKQLLSLCEKKEIVLIEDNCESLGACLDGKQAGTYGEMGTYSFFFSHHLQTMEGGMVVTNDNTLADYLRSLRAHGWIRNDENNTFNKTGNQFEDSFKFVLPGYCVRPLEFSGAVGQEQLKKWPKMLSQRRLNAETAKKIFQNSDKIFLQQETGESSWFGFGLILTGNLEGKRREVINELQKSGVECRPIVAGNFTKNPVIKYLNCEALSEYPAAEKIDKDGFFIGNDSIDLTEKISYAYKIINSVV